VIFHGVKCTSTSLQLYLLSRFELFSFARNKIENTIGNSESKNKICLPSNIVSGVHKQGQISLSVTPFPHVYLRYLYLALILLQTKSPYLSCIVRYSDSRNPAEPQPHRTHNLNALLPHHTIILCLLFN
jgi:hypothetical protein